MRGTANRKAFDFLQRGAQEMTFPCYTESCFRQAYSCFANAVIEDCKSGSVRGDPITGFDAKRLDDIKKANDRKTKPAPGYWRAHSWMSYCLVAAYLEGHRTPSGGVPFGDLDEAKKYAQRAERLCADCEPKRGGGKGPPTDYVVPWVLGHYYLASAKDKARGLEYYRKALRLNGDNNMNLVTEYGEALIAIGQHDEALRILAKVRQGRPWYVLDRAWAYYFKGRQDKAYYGLVIDELRRLGVLPHEREFPGEAFLVAAAAHVQRDARGDAALAEKARERFLDEKRGWTLKDEEASVPFLEDDDRRHWLDGCRKAGLA